MNQENEEQRPIPQTFCGALQKEANCKCLVLSILIYGCLGAVTWCRCANVTKVVFDFVKYPLTRTKHVSPCDDGYVYIPVAFMSMLYLVYLVECYHSPIRIDLLHARSDDSILTKLAQLRMAQATIWWKAISYHYVRRKRQITRYRNGDNYTTTQVYYERVNTHAATSFYFYGYCGVKDISKELILDTKLPITKISLTKGFAFSNMRSATEFEEARSRFFAEQEHRDDYMEMREGLDLGYNFNPTSLVAVLGKPWFTNAYVYWSLSALLLSWPLRIIIECNTQYADYQITKLFGVNYDTPAANGQPIHASSGQLSAPGSYMLVPSYSEALLMEPAPVPAGSTIVERTESDMVPSYSEALLYERAYNEVQGEVIVEQGLASRSSVVNCECPCHGSDEDTRTSDATGALETGTKNEDPSGEGASKSCPFNAADGSVDLAGNGRACVNCEETSDGTLQVSSGNRLVGGVAFGPEMNRKLGSEKCHMTRESSEPNLRTNSELFVARGQFVRSSGKSLENILEHDETDGEFCSGQNHQRYSNRAEALILEDDDYEASVSTSSSKTNELPSSRGAIPKKLDVSSVQERAKKIPSSRTYFCIKSILKQNRRRYTLVTPEELQNLVGTEETGDQTSVGPSSGRGCNPHCCGAHWARIDVNSNTLDEQVGAHSRRSQLLRDSFESLGSSRGGDFSSQKRENSRTLIFASPIQEICPSDPFRGRTVVPSENPPNYDEALDLPVLSRLKRSFTERETRNTGPNIRRHHRTFSIEPEYLFSGARNSERGQGDGRPYDVVIPVQNTRVVLPNQYRRAISEDGAADVRHPGTTSCRQGDDAANSRLSRLTRSLTERSSTRPSAHHNFRWSFADRIDLARNCGRRTNINMETSL